MINVLLGSYFILFNICFLWNYSKCTSFRIISILTFSLRISTEKLYKFIFLNYLVTDINFNYTQDLGAKHHIAYSIVVYIYIYYIILVLPEKSHWTQTLHTCNILI